MNNFMKLIGASALTVVSAVINGYVVSTLWQWFVANTFHLQTITASQAFGLGLVVVYITSHYKKNQDISLKEAAAYVLTKPVVFLLAGWITTKFM